MKYAQQISLFDILRFAFELLRNAKKLHLKTSNSAAKQKAGFGLEPANHSVVFHSDYAEAFSALLLRFLRRLIRRRRMDAFFLSWEEMASFFFILS
jgi:hypothetical protein